MLVLSRKKGESIIINNDIDICVIEIRGDKVRLGVSGPKEMTLHRREVYEALREGAAAHTGPPSRSDLPDRLAGFFSTPLEDSSSRELVVQALISVVRDLTDGVSAKSSVALLSSILSSRPERGGS